MFREQILRNLVMRLELVAAWTRWPEILEQEVSPVFAIVALPRTGTTLLHNLLALDPRARTPRTWELMFPCPPPEEKDFEGNPRIDKTARIASALDKINRHGRIHPMVAAEPDECFYILENTFSCVSFDGTAPMPSYTQWLLAQDRRWVYAWHRRVLQLLQWRCRRDHWVLKSPLHLFALDVLLETYPGTRIIQTHRNPVDAVASCCSLYESAREMYCNSAEPERLGERWANVWSEGLRRAMSVRQRLPATQVCDVEYDDLVADPVATVAGIYRHFGMQMPEEMPARMNAWLSDNPQHKRGMHAYQLDRYGLRTEEVLERFGRHAPARTRQVASRAID